MAATLMLALPARADPLTDLTTEFNAALAKDLGNCEARMSLGLWPFDAARLPIGDSAAEHLYNDLVAGLVASAPACVDVMDGAGIGAVLQYLHRTGALREAGGNPVAALEAANREVHIVVLPKLLLRNEELSLSLKGVERATGRTIAQTAAQTLPASLTDAALTDTARDLETAVAQAVKALAGQISDMTRLVPAGVYYQDSGAQPDFARYFQDRVVAGLVEATANVITDRSLTVLEPEFDLAKDLGRTLSPRDLDPLSRIAERSGPQGLYQLRGTYWVLGEVVDLTLTLQGAEGRTASWQGRLRRSGLGELALLPSNSRLEDDPGETRSFAILMTSPRGENPVYHPGEELVVYFRTDLRVWLYCFYIDSQGGVAQVLPNMFQKDFARGHMLSPYVLHALPDPRRDPFTFRIDASTLGEERLKCLATTRNVTDDLPPPLRGESFDAIPPAMAARIDTIFEALPDTRLSGASVTVTITPED